jgi:hypothetical protein
MSIYFFEGRWTIYLCEHRVALTQCLVGLNSNIHFQYCSWTSSIVYCNFDICRVRWLSRFLFHLLNIDKFQRSTVFYSGTNFIRFIAFFGGYIKISLHYFISMLWKYLIFWRYLENQVSTHNFSVYFDKGDCRSINHIQ